MFSYSSQPLGVKEVLISAFNLATQFFSKIWPVAAVFTLMNHVAMWLGNDFTIAYNVFKQQAIDNPQLQFDYYPYFATNLSSGLLSIASGLVSILLLVWLHKLVLKPSAALSESISQVVGRLGSSVATIMLLVLVLAFGFLMLLLPGVYLLVVLSMVFPVLMFEDKRIFASIKGSYHLVKGSWWHTAGCLSAAMLLMVLIDVGCMTLVGHPDMTQAFANGNWLAIGMSFVANLLSVVFYVSVSLVLYHNLKQRLPQQPAVPTTSKQAR